MKKKFNLALVPKTLSTQIIQLSQQLAFMADTYQLGAESLPHITLCQFYAEPKRSKEIWQAAKQQLQPQELKLTFLRVSCDHIGKKLYWISLMPDSQEELICLQQVAASIVGKETKNKYDPHMTLINSRDAQYEVKAGSFIQTYQPITDQFTLVMGASDEVGQFKKILFRS